MSSITPCGYRVLVKPDDVEKVSKGGIVLAVDEKLEKAGQVFGTLAAVGMTAWNDEPSAWAELGDRVMYSKYAGKTILDPADGNEYTLLNDVDIIAIVPKDVEDSRIDGEITR